MGKINDRIFKHFPSRRKLAYNDFICDEIVRHYYGNEERISKIFEYISRPWKDIPWDLIEKVSFDGDGEYHGYSVIDHLNERSFIHVFPSLLNEVAGEGSDSDVSSYFVSNHLDLRGVFKDWELEFYFSLNDEIVKLINLILRLHDAQYGSQDAMNAIDVYWH